MVREPVHPKHYAHVAVVCSTVASLTPKLSTVWDTSLPRANKEIWFGTVGNRLFMEGDARAASGDLGA